MKLFHYSLVRRTYNPLGLSHSLQTRTWRSQPVDQNPSRLKWLKLYFCFEKRNIISELKIRLKWNSKILSRVLSFYWIKKSNFPFMWNRSRMFNFVLYPNKLELVRINRNTRTGNVKTSKTSEKCQKTHFYFKKFKNSKQSLM